MARERARNTFPVVFPPFGARSQTGEATGLISMTPHLTIVYSTNRKDPKIQWFLDSLRREVGSSQLPRLVIVDFHFDSSHFPKAMGYSGEVINTSPKPCVWQREHRLTKEDYFAASNARNTGLCYAPDGWIAYVDDLSVLMPGWLNCINEAMAGNYIVCGTYHKVKKLVVENGDVKSCEEYPQGKDNRANYVKQDVSVCEGGWMYGCSVAGPVEAFLTVNGWPEACDGLGFEDCCMGVVLKNAGFDLRFDRRMMTYESEEDHYKDAPFKKDDWHFENGVPVRGGNGHDDKSHSILNIAKQSKMFPNYCNIRELRKLILSGEPFPIDQNPRHDWYTKIALEEL